MNIIIAGGRDFEDYKLLRMGCWEFLDMLDHRKDKFIHIVSGKAPGADTLGEKFAKEYGYKIIECPADWEKYGKSAGFRRNVEMANISKALIAFWDGQSKGTKNMIDIAIHQGLIVKVVKYEPIKKVRREIAKNLKNL